MNVDPLHVELWLLSFSATVLRISPCLLSDLVEDLAWNAKLDAVLKRVPSN
jgi:hypothetical protein